MENKVSAILITREKYYPEIVLERIDQNFDFFEEILIVTECQSIYHRYLAAGKAKCDHIFVADDDVLLNYPYLYSFYDGVRLTNGMTKEFIDKYSKMGCSLVGFGAFFPKTMMACFDKYINKYGIDSTLLREADRVFTAMNIDKINTITMPHEDLFQTEDRMGYQENHYSSMNEALEKCKNL